MYSIISGRIYPFVGTIYPFATAESAKGYIMYRIISGIIYPFVGSYEG
jgi:hypothetical protein